MRISLENVLRLITHQNYKVYLYENDEFILIEKSDLINYLFYTVVTIDEDFNIAISL